jgi:hypothetical protein
MTVKTGTVPPEGWHYPVGEGVKLEATSRDDLINMIFTWRLRNNVPQGDIARDIDDYYCTKWPSSCAKEPKDYGVPAGVPDARETMLTRVSRWAAHTAALTPKGGYPLATKSESERRAAVCVACPRQKNWRTGCTSCSASAVALLHQVAQLRSTSKDGLLFGCEVMGWDNKTAVHLQLDTPPKTEAFPPGCWFPKK